MSIRRMMMMGLENHIRVAINIFKSNITTNAVYEAGDYLYSNLDTLNNNNLLGDAALIITPNAYNEGILHTVRGNTISNITNLMIPSEGTGVIATSLNITNNSIVADTNPFGVTQSIKLIPNATNGVHQVSTPTFTTLSGLTYSYSIYMKKGSGITSPDIMQVYSINSTPQMYANFNIFNGSIGTSSNCVATIATASNGWWRCSLVYNATTTVTTTRLGVAFCNNSATASITPSYSDATTSDTLIWGVQTEIGASSSTYQPIPYTRNLAAGYAEWTRSTTGYNTDLNGNVNEMPQANLIPFSQALNSWSNVNLTVGIDAIIAPDGTLTADSSTATGVSRRHQIGSSGYYSLAPVDNYVFSAYVKQGAGTATTITLTNNSSLTAPAGTFNITNGTISSTAGCSASISDEGNGWYRCAIYVTNTSLGTVIIGHNGTVSILACYFWGMQVTRGTTLQPYYSSNTRVNTPRIDYEDGEPVLLLEQITSNTLLQSETFDNVSWTKNNISVTANTAIAPNGLMVADTITATANNGYIIQTAASFITATKIGSIYLKRKTGTGSVTLEIGRTTATASTINSTSWTRFNVNDTAVSGTYSIIAGAHSITTSVPHGMTSGEGFRFQVVTIATGTGAVSLNITNTAIATGPTTLTFTSGTASASGTCNVLCNHLKLKLATSGDEVYAWGAQLEAYPSGGSFFLPMSYIPTTTSAASKGLDTLSISKSNLLTNNFSIFYEVKKIGGGNSQDYHIALTDFTGLNAFFIYGLPLGSRKLDAGVNTTLTFGGYVVTNNTYYKGLITCNNGIFDIWIDGSKIVTSTMINYQLMNYLSLTGSNNGVAKFRKVYGWNRVLNRTEIDSLFQFPYYNSGYTPVNYELQQVINRAYSEGFTLPSTTTLGYCDTLITQMKNDGAWLITDLFFNFAFNNTALTNFSRINWKNPNSKLIGLGTINGTLTYRVDGFKGNPAGLGYIDSNFNPSSAIGIPYNYTQNNAGRMLVISEDAGISFTVYEGNTGTSTRMMPFLSNLGAFTSNTFNSAAATIDTRGVGLKSIMRDSSTVIRIQNGATTLSTTQAVSTITNNSQLLFRVSSTYSDACITTYWLGASLTNTQVSNFRTYYNTFLTNVGLSTFA